MEPFTTLFSADEASLLAFRWRLAEAIAWAERHTLPKPEQIAWTRQPENIPDRSWSYHALRSPLREAIQGIDLEQIHLSTIPIEKEGQFVEAVVRARAEMLRAESRYPLDMASDLNGGALIAYYADINMNDGAVAFVSDGYFDVANVPPFESWIGMVRAEKGRVMRKSDRWDGNKYVRSEWGEACNSDYLISYAPSQSLDMANRAVGFAPEECIIQFDNLDTPFIRLLFAAKIITPAWSTPDSPGT